VVFLWFCSDAIPAKRLVGIELNPGPTEAEVNVTLRSTPSITCSSNIDSTADPKFTCMECKCTWLTGQYFRHQSITPLCEQCYHTLAVGVVPAARAVIEWGERYLRTRPRPRLLGAYINELNVVMDEVAKINVDYKRILDAYLAAFNNVNDHRKPVRYFVSNISKRFKDIPSPPLVGIEPNPGPIGTIDDPIILDDYCEGINMDGVVGEACRYPYGQCPFHAADIRMTVDMAPQTMCECCSDYTVAFSCPGCQQEVCVRCYVNDLCLMCQEQCVVCGELDAGYGMEYRGNALCERCACGGKFSLDGMMVPAVRLVGVEENPGPLSARAAVQVVIVRDMGDTIEAFSDRVCNPTFTLQDIYNFINDMDSYHTSFVENFTRMQSRRMLELQVVPAARLVGVEENPGPVITRSMRLRARVQVDPCPNNSEHAAIHSHWGGRCKGCKEECHNWPSFYCISCGIHFCYNCNHPPAKRLVGVEENPGPVITRALQKKIDVDPHYTRPGKAIPQRCGWTPCLCRQMTRSFNRVYRLDAEREAAAKRLVGIESNPGPVVCAVCVHDFDWWECHQCDTCGFIMCMECASYYMYSIDICRSCQSKVEPPATPLVGIEPNPGPTCRKCSGKVETMMISATVRQYTCRKCHATWSKKQRKKKGGIQRPKEEVESMEFLSRWCPYRNKLIPYSEYDDVDDCPNDFIVVDATNAKWHCSGWNGFKVCRMLCLKRECRACRGVCAKCDQAVTLCVCINGVDRMYKIGVGVDYQPDPYDSDDWYGPPTPPYSDDWWGTPPSPRLVGIEPNPGPSVMDPFYHQLDQFHPRPVTTTLARVIGLTPAQIQAQVQYDVESRIFYMDCARDCYYSLTTKQICDWLQYSDEIERNKFITYTQLYFDAAQQQRINYHIHQQIKQALLS
jgi:hypothetical protein